MTRRQMFVLPVLAAIPAFSKPAPHEAYATVYLGRFTKGTGDFVRRKLRVPGPWIVRSRHVKQIGIIDVTMDVRESVNMSDFRDEYAPVLRAISDYYVQHHSVPFVV